MNHEVAALAATWHSRRARRIEAGLPVSSPEVFDNKDDTAMEMGSDETASALAPHVHSGYTMVQAHTPYDAAIVEGQPTLASTLVLEWVMKPCQFALGQIDGERVIREALLVVATTNPNFVVEQRAIYDAFRAQATAHQEALRHSCG
ncbi:NHL repeat-containing protein 2 [Hordeum vulgare]|nr:NHL repeat-containing protein 2 [Hordeum vulgare]